MKNFSNYNDYSLKKDLAFESRAIHGALGNDPMTGAVSFPIFQTATFRHKALGQSTGYDYSRLQNPTRQELERTMAILEEGTEAFAFSSGQAANMALFTWLTEKKGQKWLESFSLSFSMILGMASAILYQSVILPAIGG